MKIAIVGANGQVGKELALIFREGGHTVTGIVRNPFGAGFFKIEKIDYIICDITRGKEADNILSEADIIVIAAVARGAFEEAYPINERLISATLGKASSGASVVFFSSIRVFSRQIDTSMGRFDPLPAYDREKRASEKCFENLCGQTGIKGRIFRLGHVIGEHQAKVVKFREQIDSFGIFRVNPNAPSNCVHVLTICDAIIKSSEDDRAMIIATLVNEPQWTWKVTFEFLAPAADLRFAEVSQDTAVMSKTIVRTILKALKPFKKWLKSYKRYLKGSLSYSVYLEGRRGEILEDLASLYGESIQLSEFSYKAAPGPFLDGLEVTIKLLEDRSK